MTFDRKDLEEVGEAVESLGIMLERELGLVQQRLVELHRFLVRSQEEGNLRTQTENLKQEIGKAVRSLEKFEKLLSRTESKLADVQNNVSDQENLFGEMKSELAAVKRELQLFRSDMVLLFKEQECLKFEASDEGNEGDLPKTRKRQR
jgi:septation ring formation regulator EzrA